MLRPSKMKGFLLLHGLNADSILEADENADATSSTQRVTRQALHGEPSEPLYNMKYHPMDEVTRPSQTKRRRGARAIVHTTTKNDLDSDTDQEKDMSGVGLSSEKDYEEEAEYLRRRRGTTTPARKSTRAATQKLINYDMKKHPQDKQLIKSGICQPKRRPKANVAKKQSIVEQDTKEAATKEVKLGLVRFGKTYVAEGMDVFAHAPGSHYWPDGRDYKVHETFEPPVNEIVHVDVSGKKQRLQDDDESEEDDGMDDLGVGFSQDVSVDESELMEAIDELSDALHTKRTAHKSATDKDVVATDGSGADSGINKSDTGSEKCNGSKCIIDTHTTEELTHYNTPPKSAQEACQRDVSQEIDPLADLSQAAGNTPKPTSESNIERQALSSPCLNQEDKSKPDAEDPYMGDGETTNKEVNPGDRSECRDRIVDKAGDSPSNNNDQVSFRINLHRHGLATATGSPLRASLPPDPVSANRVPEDLVAPDMPPVRVAYHEVPYNTVNASAPSSRNLVGSSLPDSASILSRTPGTLPLSPDYQAPPSRQPDLETAPDRAEAESSSNTSRTAGRDDHSMELCVPSPHRLAGEALRNGVSFSQVVNPTSSGDASPHLTGSFLISSQASVGQAKDISKRRVKRQALAFTVHEDAQEHEITFAQHIMNRFQNSACIDYPKENQQAESETAEANLRHDSTTRYGDEQLSRQQHQHSDASSEGPQDDVERQIQAEIASFSQLQRP